MSVLCPKIVLALKGLSGAHLEHENKKQMVPSARLVFAFRGAHPRMHSLHHGQCRPDNISGIG